ncbi:dtdp-glucose 4,6-dehydratase [Aulographum hederae CBS 113979]|uniref:Dtdp-glucose 4,6-dehydratase n=1 Tax=Aulographum hederae CBS 113979 TaxID=1176131 RepID=A0A6G1HER3_9PEZI|nr:dtdp-glucose 4,6-dehydratase [Aulographum hederae CBS 113979]
MSIGIPVGSGLDSRFFVDSHEWEQAPLLRGTTRYEPLSSVRNIMITGGEGFIGSWVVRHLVLTYPEAYNIVSFDKLDYCSSLNNTRMLDGKGNFKFVHGDVTSPEDVMRCLRTYNIDTVIHFAAQSHVDLSFGNSYAFTRNNVYGTHVLLESAKEVGIGRFIHVSTDEVYGEVDDDAEDLLEHSLLAPTNPYAASKAAAEMMVTAYSKSFQLPAILVRSNNVYGPHQYPEKVIPKFINLLMRNQKLTVHGNGKHSRRYLWAGDAADAFDTVLHKGVVGHVYNVSSQDEVTNLELCAKLLNQFGISDTKGRIEYTNDRPFNDYRYAVNGSKLQALGWKQQLSFEEGLRRTVEWYRDFPEWWGDISSVLTAFPEVEGQAMVSTNQAKHTGALIEALRETNGNAGKQADVGAERVKQMANGETTAKKRKLDETEE